MNARDEELCRQVEAARTHFAGVSVWESALLALARRLDGAHRRAGGTIRRMRRETCPGFNDDRSWAYRACRAACERDAALAELAEARRRLGLDPRLVDADSLLSGHLDRGRHPRPGKEATPRRDDGHPMEEADREVPRDAG